MFAYATPVGSRRTAMPTASHFRALFVQFYRLLTLCEILEFGCIPVTEKPIKKPFLAYLPNKEGEGDIAYTKRKKTINSLGTA